ncbi:tRNA pseudouridine(55) synthase TruB [Pantoea sp. Aalb]|uniref:tRNA pseudouridine(55) synthase TruB n=1 Tax=Pantoea sp. Aalb TaxID=2576762 RepID=UPI001F364407|nr:tRNA pseudouridine(55) synthase TruB [Pantoea sp. Aalb]
MSNAYSSRDIHGVLLLDKNKGISSNSILQKVKHLFHANKAGHTGSLDPLATGMLPICFGEATKFSQYLLNSDKRYRVIAYLGQRTNTSDSDGKIIQIRPLNFNQYELNHALNSFLGKTLQVPSMFSALKYQGRPLYEYARQNIEIKRIARPILIYDLLLIRWEDHEIELEVYCSKGTYIRTIIDDLGEKLKCGAHVIMLRRLGVSEYSANEMITLEYLENLIKQANMQGISYLKLLDNLLLPVDSPIAHFPEVNLDLHSLNVIYFKNGHKVQISKFKLEDKGLLVRVTEGKIRKFIGIGQIDEHGNIVPKRLIVNLPLQ